MTGRVPERRGGIRRKGGDEWLRHHQRHVSRDEVAHTASFSSSARTAPASSLTRLAASSERERTAARRVELCWVKLTRVA